MSVKRWRARPWLLLTVLSIAIPAGAASWKEKVLYSFQGLPDGSVPSGGVVFDTAGNLYGATIDGGANNCPGITECGTVYQLKPPVQKGKPWNGGYSRFTTSPNAATWVVGKSSPTTGSSCATGSLYSCTSNSPSACTGPIALYGCVNGAWSPIK